jgi:hypothetical protein
MMFLKGLIVFTVIGLATECCFNGVRDQINRKLRGEPVDWQLPCRTWLWSILVFGLSSAISFPLLLALYPQIFAWHWLVRGLFYLLGIYAWEYFWGCLLETLLGRCPWEYEASPYRIWRYLRPRFAPLWFAFGFILEWAQLRLLPVLDQAWS